MVLTLPETVDLHHYAENGPKTPSKCMHFGNGTTTRITRTVLRSNTYIIRALAMSKHLCNKQKTLKTNQGTIHTVHNRLAHRPGTSGVAPRASDMPMCAQ